MATLNLRISGNKNKSISGKYHKNVSTFPSHSKPFYLWMKKELEKKAQNDQSTLIQCFLDTLVVDDLLALLKKISQMTVTQQTESQIELTQIVVTIYLLSDPQFHLKNAALKILELPSLRSTAIEELQSRLVKYLDSLESLGEQNMAAGTLLHLARSQILGENIICYHWETLIKFLTCVIKAHFDHLNGPNEDTPTQQAAVFSGLHSLCQAVVTVIQTSSKSPTHESKCDILEKQLELVLIPILLNPPVQLPSDTQNTCAMALVLISKKNVVNNTQLWECLQECCVGVKMSLCAALVSTLGPELNLPVQSSLAATLNSKHGISIIEAIFSFLVSNTGKSCEATLLLGGCRALASVAKSLVQISSVRPDLLSILLPPAIDHCLTHLEHHMDSVRHASKGMLESLLVAAKDGKDLDQIIKGVQSLLEDSKARFAGVSVLAVHAGSGRLLKDFPNLVHWLLSATQAYGTAPHACSALEVLMRCHINPDVAPEEWCSVWVQPMLDFMPSSSLEPALAKAVQLRPQTLPFILYVCKDQELDEKSVKSTNKLKVLLSCLKMAQKCNMLKEEQADHWKGVMAWTTLKFAMVHSEDEVRLAAIALLIESRKSTEALCDEELKQIALGLKFCGDSHAPSTQHKATALIKKLLGRLNDSHRGILKRQEPIDDYLNFLTELCTSAFSDLFPGSALGRRSLALNTLVLVLDLLVPQDPWSKVWDNLCTKSHAQVLLDCLSDTYETNKNLVLILINAFPSHSLGFDDGSNVKELINWCISLSESHKPPDSVTAAYVFSTIIERPECLGSLQEISKSNFSGRLSACTLLVQRLEIQLTIARESILQAAAKGPMYGTLLCIRHLLSSANLLCLAETKEGEDWRNLVDKLVDICFQLNAVVAPVVNSSSPEGHLPMDFGSDITTQLKKTTLEESKTQTIRVTAQMVLLCSWRTVKEVSLLLGELAAGAPANENSEYLLSNEQLISIGEHFTQLLCETKHRGAFEQAYVGFCRLCAWLWRVPSGELPQLPSKWLEELLAAVVCEEEGENGTPRLAGKLCATRRSAGVPFIVQALVTTELEVRERPECFPGAVARLLDLAGHTGAPQVHALNILRALFRSSQLGEHVAPYIAQGFSVAIHAFKGSSWAERNAATLLFSALMGRVFGVKHTPGHEELPRKNRMTGRIFFRLYPSLFELLASELTEAAELISARNVEAQLTPSLHPVLLILARLYPSSLEGTDTSLNLLLLRDSVVTCAGSPVLHTRELAAKALVPLVDPSTVATFISSLQLTKYHNQLHGTLLQLIGLSESCESSCELTSALQLKLKEGLPLLSATHTCDITKCAFLKLLTTVLSKHPAAIDVTMEEKLNYLISNLLITPGSIGFSILKPEACRVLLHLATRLNHFPALEILLEALLYHPLPDVVHVALVFILATTEADQGEISGDAPHILELSKIKFVTNFGSEIRKSVKIAQSIVNLTGKWISMEGQAVCMEFRTSLFFTLSRLAPIALQADWSKVIDKKYGQPIEEEIILWMLEQEEEERLGLVNHMLLACCGELIFALQSKPSNLLMTRYSAAVLRNAGEEGSLASHLVAAQSLCRVKDKLFTASCSNVCSSYCSVMCLLRDSSDVVRSSVSQLWPWLSCLAISSATEALALHLVHNFASLDLQTVLATLLFWAFGDMLTGNQIHIDLLEEENQDHERVFDKGDVALSLEELKLTEAARNALSSLLKQESKDAVIIALHKPLIWLPVIDTPATSLNLHSLLKKTLLDVSEPTPHFLHPTYQRSVLNKLKVKCMRLSGVYDLV